MGKKACESCYFVLQLALVGVALWFFAQLPGVLGLFGMVAGAVLLSSLVGMAIRRAWERAFEAPARLRGSSAAFLKTRLPLGG